MDRAARRFKLQRSCGVYSLQVSSKVAIIKMHGMVHGMQNHEYVYVSYIAISLREKGYTGVRYKTALLFPPFFCRNNLKEYEILITVFKLL